MERAGRLDLLLSWDGRRVTAAEVRSSRPPVARVLRGKPVEEALRLVPLLFSLCGQAQGRCAEAAVAAACGRHPDEDKLRRRSDVILREAAGEHLWRLLLDWPAAVGLPQRRQELALARKRLAAASSTASWREALDDILAASLLGQPARQWLDGELAAWSATAAPAAELWRLVSAASARLEAVKPVSRENSPLARLQGRLPVDLHPVAARFLARLAELALWAAGHVPPPGKVLRGHSGQAGQGEALALVARGSLHHRLRLEEGRVADYAIEGPTDWNFHPAGPFAREAVGIVGATEEEVAATARLLALSLDPCVAVEVSVKREREHA